MLHDKVKVSNSPQFHYLRLLPRVRRAHAVVGHRGVQRLRLSRLHGQASQKLTFRLLTPSPTLLISLQRFSLWSMPVVAATVPSVQTPLSAAVAFGIRTPESPMKASYPLGSAASKRPWRAVPGRRHRSRRKLGSSRPHRRPRSPSSSWRSPQSRGHPLDPHQG